MKEIGIRPQRESGGAAGSKVPASKARHARGKGKTPLVLRKIRIPVRDYARANISVPLFVSMHLVL
jgi:hypothetical protein